MSSFYEWAALGVVGLILWEQAERLAREEPRAAWAYRAIMLGPIVLILALW